MNDSLTKAAFASSGMVTMFPPRLWKWELQRLADELRFPKTASGLKVSCDWNYTIRPRRKN